MANNPLSNGKEIAQGFAWALALELRHRGVTTRFRNPFGGHLPCLVSEELSCTPHFERDSAYIAELLQMKAMGMAFALQGCFGNDIRFSDPELPTTVAEGHLIKTVDSGVSLRMLREYDFLTDRTIIKFSVECASVSAIGSGTRIGDTIFVRKPMRFRPVTP